VAALPAFSERRRSPAHPTPPTFLPTISQPRRRGLSAAGTSGFARGSVDGESDRLPERKSPSPRRRTRGGPSLGVLLSPDSARPAPGGTRVVEGHHSSHTTQLGQHGQNVSDETSPVAVGPHRFGTTAVRGAAVGIEADGPPSRVPEVPCRARRGRCPKPCLKRSGQASMPARHWPRAACAKTRRLFLSTVSADRTTG
jgi:hypothetical protein